MATFDAGSISATLTLDRSPFTRELDAARAQGERMEGREFKARLGIDKARFAADLADARRQLTEFGQRTPKAKLQLDSAAFTADVAKARAQLDKLGAGDKALRVKLNVDGAGQAATELEGVKAAADSVPDRVDVKVDVDKNRTGRDALQALIGLGIALAPAIVPAAADSAAAVFGLAAAGTAAAGAGAIVAGGLALVAKNAVDTQKTLDKLVKTMDDTSKSADVRAQAARDYADAIASMDPATKAAVFGVQALQDNLGKLEQRISGRPTARLLALGFSTLSDALVPLPGLFHAVLPAAQDLLGEFDDWVHGPGYTDFLRFFETQGPPALKTAGRLFGSAATSVGHLFEAFAPFGQGLLSDIADDTEHLSVWLDKLKYNPEFASFLGYVKQTGPEVVDVLRDTGGAVISIGRALAPLGSASLHGLDTIVKGLSSLANEHGDLLAAGVAVAGLGLAIGRTVKVATGIVGPLSKLASSTREAGAAATVSKLAWLGWAGAIAGAVVGVDQLGHALSDHLASQREVVVGQDKMITAMEKFGQTGKLTSAGVRTFGADFQFFGHAATTSSGALEQLGKNAKEAFDKPWWQADRLNVWKAMDLVKNSTSQADKALARMVTSGHADQAISAFDKLSKVLRDNGASSKQVADLLPQASAAIADYRIKQDDAKTAMEGATTAADEERRALQALSDQASNSAGILTLRGAYRSYQQAIDDATASLKANGKTTNVSTAAGRANAAALDQIASSALSYQDALKKSGASADTLASNLQGAHRALVNEAEQMGYTKTQAQRLADQLLAIPKTVRTETDLDTKQAQKKADAQKKLYRDLSKGILTKADLDTLALMRKTKSAKGALDSLAKQHPTPKADLNDQPFRGKNAKVNQLMAGLDHRVATPKALLDTRVAESRNAKLNRLMTDTDRRRPTPIANLDTAAARSKAADFLGLMATLGAQRPHPRVTVTETGAAEVQARINAIRGKTVDVWIRQHHVKAGGYAMGTASVPGVQHYATGTTGVIPGYQPGVDSVPSMLSPGEAVLRPEVARALTAPVINAWNGAAAAHKLDQAPGRPAGTVNFVTQQYGNWTVRPLETEVNDQMMRLAQAYGG